MRNGPRVTVLAAAVLSAIVAWLLSSTIFSQLSVNNDEAVYLLQARAMAAGHLFPPVGHPASSFTPWLGVIHGGHYVLKYVPVVSAFLAASLVITGGYVAALACWAAAMVFATYLLARELTGDRRSAALAAVLLAASPVAVVQGALALPYVPFIVLAEIAIWGALAGCRRDDRRLLTLAGLCGALGFVARPYDAIFFAMPVFAWALWSTRTGRLRKSCWLAIGALPPCLGLLWFDQAATGSLFKLPFSLFSNGDSLGFGVHRMYPGETARHFGIVQAWDGLSRHLSLLAGGWACGGVLLLGLAVFAVLRHQASAAGLALLAGGVLLTVGYLFFWGIWNAAILWGAVRYLGPYYVMPLLVPLTILGAQGALELLRIGVWQPIGIAVAGASLSVATVVGSITTNGALNRDNVQLAATIAKLGRSLVFVDTYPSYLQHPTSVISNAGTPGGRTVYALNRGEANFAVQKAYGGRQLYHLQLLGEYGKHANRGYGAVLDHVELLAGPSLTFHVSDVLPAGATDARLGVAVGSAHREWALRHASPFQVTLAAGNGGTRSHSDRTIFGIRSDPASSATFTLTVTLRGKRRSLSHVKIPLRSWGEQLEALAPTRRVALLGPLGPAPLSVYCSHADVAAG
ncbi:MAG: hypothetical protein JWN96_1853 [Mycobacterium sp.]|nr:hypothetical protein [Mycobacterium sp.]